jgi:hypothetical protein
MAIEKKFPTNPLDIIRSGVTFVQRWSPKLKESDQEIIAKMMDKVQVWLGGFRLRNVAGLDIVEL